MQTCTTVVSRSNGRLNSNHADVFDRYTDSQVVYIQLVQSQNVNLSDHFQHHAEPVSVSLNVDNDGAIDSAENASINQHNKHIDLQYHLCVTPCNRTA